MKKVTGYLSNDGEFYSTAQEAKDADLKHLIKKLLSNNSFNQLTTNSDYTKYSSRDITNQCFSGFSTQSVIKTKDLAEYLFNNRQQFYNALVNYYINSEDN